MPDYHSYVVLSSQLRSIILVDESTWRFETSFPGESALVEMANALTSASPRL